MALFKCKMCGGDLEVTADSKIVECEYCGTSQTVPSGDDEKKTNLFNRANRLRMASEFDKASGVYESIVAEFPEEPEAYWGLCLCKYGIEYVDDPATAKKIPTCHRTSYESIFEDSNFELALEYADVVAVKLYREEAKEIDRLQKAILEIAAKEEPFDIFICYKETAEDGQRTKDSVLAQDMYDALTTKGYKVFFARITLEDKLGREYEPYIFSALNSAKIMLAVGTKYEYYNAVWVKNEWSRFLGLMKKDKEKMLIPCYCDIDAYDMPDEFRNLQGQDMSKVGFMQDLVRGIGKIIPFNNNKSSVQQTTVIQAASANVENLLKRGNLCLEEEKWEEADEFFERVLDENAEEARAYLGKFMAEYRVHSEKSFYDDIEGAIAINYFIKRLYNNDSLKQAIKYGGADMQKFADYLIEKEKYTYGIISSGIRMGAKMQVKIDDEEIYLDIYKGHRTRRDSSNYVEVEVPAFGLGAIISNFHCTKNIENANKIELPEGVSGIERNVFGNFEGQLYTPCSLANYEWPFSNGLAEIIINKNNPNFVFDNGAVYSTSKKTLYKYEGNEKTFSIPDYVTEIKDYAFAFSKLECLIIPDSVKEIGEGAFYCCNKLSSLSIPNGVTKINQKVFEECRSLTEITIPNSVIEIESEAFSFCNHLSNLSIPNSVTKIGNKAFYWCSSLKSIIIPNSITEIENEMFSYCSSMTEIAIPDSITNIGDSAFYSCESLNHIEIPNGVTTIGECAFLSCKNLKSVTISDSVTNIGENAFSNCNNLDTLNLPDNLAIKENLIEYGIYHQIKMLSPSIIKEHQRQEEEERRRREEERRHKEKERRQQEEENRLRKIREGYRSQGLCQHCGGTFKGLFTKTCTSCNKKKDY